MKTPRRVEQEEGHLPPSQGGADVPATRIALWCAVAVVVVVGLVLFFRYERQISPLFGGA